MPWSSAVRSCCGLWLHDVCSWCSDSAKILGESSTIMYTSALPLVSRTMGKVGTCCFSSLRYLKPSAWFNDVLGPALQSEKFTKYGLQWEDH